MQYKYVTCTLPSNGKLYDTKEVHLRPKTIFDIKELLGMPFFILKSEIDTLQNCIKPSDNVNVYDLVNQDVVYLLYKLRSLSDDDLYVETADGEKHQFKISELDVKFLDDWNPNITLPESGMSVTLTYVPIKNIFDAETQQNKFIKQYPEYQGDVANTLRILNSVLMVDGVTDKDHIRNKLEQLSWKDSLYLINKIEELQKLDFGVVEEVKITGKDGVERTIPIQLTEGFFRPAL